MKIERGHFLLMIVKDKYDGVMCSQALKDVARAVRGEPIDYVISWKPFLGCRIDLSLKPLIPRPETEHWAERAIAAIKNHSAFAKAMADKNAIRVADVFSGSGAIGIAVLMHAPRAHVNFGDVDPKCIRQIKKNLKINRLSKKKYRVDPSDVMGSLKGPYDFILANPPYIARAKKHKVARAVIRYEPSVALWGGENGLRFTKKLVKEASVRLAPGGELWFEFDSWQKPSLEKLLKKSPFKKFAFHKDQFGKWRYAIAKR